MSYPYPFLFILFHFQLMIFKMHIISLVVKSILFEKIKPHYFDFPLCNPLDSWMCGWMEEHFIKIRTSRAWLHTCSHREELQTSVRKSYKTQKFNRQRYSELHSDYYVRLGNLRTHIHPSTYILAQLPHLAADSIWQVALE